MKEGKKTETERKRPNARLLLVIQGFSSFDEYLIACRHTWGRSPWPLRTCNICELHEYHHQDHGTATRERGTVYRRIEIVRRSSQVAQFYWLAHHAFLPHHTQLREPSCLSNGFSASPPSLLCEVQYRSLFINELITP